jgi:hypothetical protein
MVLLQDDVSAVRIAAAEALYTLDTNANVIPTLTDILRSDNLIERVEALTVLEKMDKDAKAALTAIKEMVVLRGDKKNPNEPLWKSAHDIKIAKRIIAKNNTN